MVSFNVYVPAFSPSNFSRPSSPVVNSVAPDSSFLRLSHASLVCHPHWRPELESVLDDMYATERDYRLGCEAADAIEAACGADSVKWKRALAVGLDALTVAVAVATIRQMLTDGGVLSAIPLSALLIAVTAAAAWLSWRARRG